MPGFRPRAVLALIALLGLALPAGAAPAPIVFDFEDGLQGWELSGSAQRVQTQVLGGKWAIFGDGFVAGEAAISIELDLTGIAFVSLEQSFVEGNEDEPLIFYLTYQSYAGSPAFSFLFPLEALDPAKPGVRTTQDIRVEEVIGSFPVSISWGLDPEISSTGKRQQPLVAFIDNITFHPVPEPGTLALLASGLVALAIGGRRFV